MSLIKIKIICIFPKFPENRKKYYTNIILTKYIIRV